MGAGAEIDALASAFSTTAAEPERTEDVRRRMLSGLGHEVRTRPSVIGAPVEAHGGTLGAASAGPGRGAEFHVVLPARHAVPPGTAAPSTVPHP